MNEHSSSLPKAPRGWRASRLLLRKELKESLRDKSLLAQLVLVPLFLYPVLGMLGYQIFLVSQGVSEKQETVVWIDAATPATIREHLASRPRWILAEAPATAVEDAAEARRVFEVSDGSPQAWLQWSNEEGAVRARVFYDASSDRARRAERVLRGAVTAFEDSVRSARAENWGWTAADLAVFEVDRREVSEGSQFAGWILSLILPVVLMVMLPQGAYYATLDTIVGERERGTWETLLTSALARGEIVRGKFVYVVGWSLASTLLNLVGMLLFLWASAQIMGLGDRIDLQIHPIPALLAVMAVVLFAVAIAAVMILVAIPARSYREGQAALSPVYLVSAVGAMLAVTGSETISRAQALVPVVNVAALLRSALRGEVPPVAALLALSSLALIALVAVVLATRVLDDESIYFSDALSLRGLLRRRRVT